jgi:uncharacterized membrane protein HdeD (DUF308 family)
MKVLQLVSGIIFILIGIGLTCVPLFVKESYIFLTLLYGIPLLIIGIFILINKNEEEIEKIKTQK